MYLIILSSAILLYNFDAAFSSAQPRHPRGSDQCRSFVDGPLGFCSAKSGYNSTFQYPDIVTDSVLEKVAKRLRRYFSSLNNCSHIGLAETLYCSFAIPQCSGGKRVYPCKRVCSEFLKQCEDSLPARFLDYVIANCHVLPNESASSGKCFEPPNFTTNDSVKGPLDRDCQELIIPACKNLGVSHHTLIAVDNQKHWYLHAYKKHYKEDNPDTDFPPDFLKTLEKYPKCQENLKKMFCGEYFPPCFPDEGQGHYSICRSICDDIVRDCPEYFRNDFTNAEYCALLGKGNTSHGYCKRTEWPPPFFYARYLQDRERATDQKRKRQTEKGPLVPSKATEGVKVWAIVVAVVVALITVGLIVLASIWMKWPLGRVPGFGYKKQEDDMAPLETSVDL